MTMGFYPRLARDGMRKNRRLYLPYLLTCTGMVMMHYIINGLSCSPAVAALHGGNLLTWMLELGGRVIALFSCLFLFYTHSFLMRRRKKEFGLYNVLGMGKRHLALILLWETLFIAVIALGAGLSAGLALFKLAELGLISMMQGQIDYSLFASPRAFLSTLTVFGVIFVLLFVNALRQVEFSDAIALLHSENVGEKPPKGNWLLGLLGLVLLGAAYYIAVRINNPIAALVVFFIAVAMVIVATYLLMITGSVVFCRLLQRRRGYYYRPEHFVSVSSMTYRMKRNGAGLASICILATMVMVMLSLTASLYIGHEDTLRQRYPRDMNVILTMDHVDGLDDANIDTLRSRLLAQAEANGAAPQDVLSFRCAFVAGLLSKDGQVEVDVRALDTFTMNTYDSVYEFCFVSLADYNALTGANETLAPGEAMVYPIRVDFAGDVLAFRGGATLRVKKHLTSFFVGDTTLVSIMELLSTLVIVVPDLPAALTGLDRMATFKGDPMVTYEYTLSFDTGLPRAAQPDLTPPLADCLAALQGDESRGLRTTALEGREENRQDFLTFNGGLFYLGILLSIVFLFATVLIIYYKQISEGYEDQARFEIMQKVGMTKAAIRRSINSQMLTVFLLPLALAACHLVFAFPILCKLLLLFSLDNVLLFAAVTVGCVLLFGLFYTAVYRLTSNAYYDIVSGARSRDEA